ncbi:MAG: hypothetical protein E4H19_07905 [Chromatiales bacterium]|nr:MAG: hypothetical protein E4H19_07905 [Chromatiales bacterium]
MATCKTNRLTSAAVRPPAGVTRLYLDNNATAIVPHLPASTFTPTHQLRLNPTRRAPFRLRFNLVSFIIFGEVCPCGGFLILGDYKSGCVVIFQFCCVRTITMNMRTALQGGALALAMLISAGCASTSKLDELSARMDRVASDAAAAKSAADAAGAAASEAKQTASGAQSTANQALNAANQSQSCCDATNEKIDRMFKRSQAK